ncbi:MAG: hypothetical protein ACR2K4_03320 [Candidatus Limnocylindria bacterium]
MCDPGFAAFADVQMTFPGTVADEMWSAQVIQRDIGDPFEVHP